MAAVFKIEGFRHNPTFPAATAATAALPPMKTLLLILPLTLALGGCGLLAAPCRVASAGLKIVPVVGDVAALPTDACAEIID